MLEYDQGFCLKNVGSHVGLHSRWCPHLLIVEKQEYVGTQSSCPLFLVMTIRFNDLGISLLVRVIKSLHGDFHEFHRGFKKVQFSGGVGCWRFEL